MHPPTISQRERGFLCFNKPLQVDLYCALACQIFLSSENIHMADSFLRTSLKFFKTKQKPPFLSQNALLCGSLSRHVGPRGSRSVEAHIFLHDHRLFVVCIKRFAQHSIVQETCPPTLVFYLISIFRNV